jgi:hypothetical protein
MRQTEERIFQSHQLQLQILFKMRQTEERIFRQA